MVVSRAISPARRYHRGEQRYLVVKPSVAGAGAPLAVTCTPARTVWPAATGPAQSAPVHVTDVLTVTVHAMPQAFTMPVAVASGQVTLHPETPVVPVTRTSAT